MIIDFSKISSENSNTILNPRDIFTTLPGKTHGKFQYPRDIQAQVWEKWFNRRDEENLLLKMNTGSGKTAVGLVILKSCLNENKGPAVYVVPDNYLVKQVCDEAKDLGISVTDDPKSVRFLSGKEILVTNIHRLVNGRSIFGVGDQGRKISIGSIIIDDAHACVDTIEDQYTLSIKSDGNNLLYEKIFNEFKASIYDQCESKALEIEAGDNSAYVLVPFWTWQQKISNIKRILVEHKDSDELKFIWPLIKENLEFSRCVIASNCIEISPHCIPISMIGSLEKAHRKIFMTATLVDDSILATHFGITNEDAFQAIMPNTIGDIGDRMILLPQVIDPDLPDTEIIRLCKHVAKWWNVVVIVPSEFRANIWEDAADKILNKHNINEGIEALKSGHIGLVILINRYDGIDLPQDACRLLVIDGLPDARKLINKVEQSILLGSERTSDGIIQRIEQGMGRGVRASDDYCAIFLMGRNLINQIYVNGSLNKFSPATRAQMELSRKLSDQIEGEENSLKTIWDTLQYCLKQDNDWVSASKGELTNLVSSPIETNKVNISLRKAYDLALYRNYKGANDLLEQLANSVTKDETLQSYLKQIFAEYQNFIDEVEAQKILSSAAKANTRVLKPIQGIDYRKLDNKLDQANLCSQYLEGFDNSNKIILRLDCILADLSFMENTANKFEQALADLAFFLGFKSQRPENEYRRGPDVLWAIGALQYLIIECKNGAITEKVGKRDCNQLIGSVEWFKSDYDSSCSFIPVLIHPSNVFAYDAAPREGTRVIDKNGLLELTDNVKSFVRAIIQSNKISNVRAIQEELAHHKLLRNNILTVYSKPAIVGK